MRKAFYLFVILLFTHFGSSAQSNDLKQAFDRAYVQYPAIPHGLLEAMAFSASKFQNLSPDPSMADHHGPERFGLFASVEDGHGIFKNTLINICNNAGIAPAQYKADPNVQIMAFAKYLSDACIANHVNGNIKKAEKAIEAVSEIPLNNPVNEYANQLIAYEVFTNLKKGIHSGAINIAPVKRLKPNHWFVPNNYKILSAKTVTISGSNISGNHNIFRSSSSGNNPPPGSSRSTPDYPSALWVTSPNYNSRGTTAISAITIHTTEGSYAGSISWFQDTASNVSAHYILRSSDGQVTQMVLEANRAWHVGTENSYTIGIEHEGYVAQTGWYTTNMYQSSAALVRNICTRRTIDPRTCYSGPSSTGINVLSSAYKIKGHQHYPNQTHTDPGINWNWVTYFNLINPCAAPTGLTVSNITGTTATLSWTAASWVATYTIEVRPVGSSTWTDYIDSTNTLSLTGLNTGMAYEWQVKVNCTSSDPSPYTAGGNFSTVTNGCVAPVVSATNISTSTATLSWTAVTGAVSYEVDWKTSAASTWTTATTTATTYSLAWLTASTAYQYRIKTNCSAGASGYSTVGTFTTQASCYDANESNNSSGTATVLTAGVPKFGKICGASTDVDWFKFTTTSTLNITFSLTQLPANYNVELYINGSYVKGSYNGDTSSELITLRNQPAGTFYYRVYGASATEYNSTRDYRVNLTTNGVIINNPPATSAQTLSGRVLLAFSPYPNPAQNHLKLGFILGDRANVELSLMNYDGQSVLDQKMEYTAGEQAAEFDLSSIPSGLYLADVYL
jgi:N-acetyl-anhydromuramyl-L-alanine amidase AmpD